MIDGKLKDNANNGPLKKMSNPRQIRRFHLRSPFLVGATIVVLLSGWLFFNFKFPWGLFTVSVVMLGIILDRFLKGDVSFPKIQRISAVLFLLFLICGAVVLKPNLIMDELLKIGLFLLFGGLAVLSGIPVLFHWGKKVNVFFGFIFFLLGVCFGTWLFVVGVLGIFHIPSHHPIALILQLITVPPSIIFGWWYWKKHVT